MKNMDVTYKIKSLILTLNLATAGSVVFSIYEKQFKTGLHLQTITMHVNMSFTASTFSKQKVSKNYQKNIKKL